VERKGVIAETKRSIDFWASPAYWLTWDTDEKLPPCTAPSLSSVLLNDGMGFPAEVTSCLCEKLFHSYKTYTVELTFIFVCMDKKKTMKLWFQFLNIHNEF
jgi:hypothetical protein